jgi:hypothetical protein
MNVGQQTVEWLFSEQLKVDAEWSVKVPGGFRWWAYQHAQTVKVAGQEVGPDGDVGYLISVRTDLLRNVELNEKSLSTLNALLMQGASMAGPVYSVSERTVSLCSIVKVHGGISGWMRPIISVAACLQIGEARIIGSQLAQHIGAQEALSGHPENGLRPAPDEMAGLIDVLIAPMGRQPSKWSPAEFDSVVKQHMQRPPAMLATAGDPGLTVEFPFGERSSLCRLVADQRHPRLGNGLLILQSFPIEDMEAPDGVKLALSLNQTELTEQHSGYGFGIYACREGMLHFSCFFPNAMYRPGLLPNLYFTCASRARAVALRLTGVDWTEEAFKPSRTGIGGLLDRLRNR